MEEAEGAFRHMAQAKHIGKVVIRQWEGGAERGVIRGDGTYLISGGLGALGKRVARWLIEQGGRHVVLVGRSGAGEGERAELQEMERSGAKVVVMAGDVGREGDVARVLERIDETMPALRGVVHAAGEVDDGILMEQRWERFEKVMSGKAGGAWNLHRQTRGRGLDFFVLFSSAASILGSAGQGNYAAANAMLDALAQRRRAQGLCGVSINWGPWGGGGMAARAEGRSGGWGGGVGRMAPEEGLEALGGLLRSEAAQVAVLELDVRSVMERFEAGRRIPLLEELAPDAAAEARQSPHGDFLNRLMTAPPKKQLSLLTAHVREQTVKLLGLNPARPPAPCEPLSNLGLDSLMAVELRNTLGSSLGRVLPATLLFDYPTIGALAAFLAGEVLNLQPPPLEFSEQPGEEDEKLDAFLASVRDLPEDQVAKAIRRKTADTGTR
jgi:acyl carrier protein